MPPIDDMEKFLKFQLDRRLENGGRAPLQVSTHYGWCARGGGLRGGLGLGGWQGRGRRAR